MYWTKRRNSSKEQHSDVLKNINETENTELQKIQKNTNPWLDSILHEKKKRTTWQIYVTKVNTNMAVMCVLAHKVYLAAQNQVSIKWLTGTCPSNMFAL